MCDLFLLLGIKGLVHVVYIFSTNNFKQKNLLKTIFELRIKAKVSTKCIYYNYTKFVFCFFAVHKLCRTLVNLILHFAFGMSLFMYYK